MPHTLWRPSIALALHRNRTSPVARFVQLATLRADGRPAVRTVVFRGFLEETHRLTFATDARSTKARELGRSPWAEACWYFPVTREQFRLSGDATLAGPNTADLVLKDARRALWRELSDESRLSYTWPEPGVPRDPGPPFPTAPPDREEPLPHFLLLVLEAREVDHLELEGNPQHRWKYTRQGTRWKASEVNP